MKQVKTIERLSNLTVLKLLLIGNLVWTFVCIVLMFVYILGASLIDPESLPNMDREGPIILWLLHYWIIISVAVNVMLFLFYGVSTMVGLWLYSMVRPIRVVYLELENEKI